MNYLDNAATTLVKPRAVGEAVHRALTGAAGYARGGYAAAQRAGDLVYDCREQAAALFGLYDPSRVVFTQNATHALNIAIHALARPGMKVAVSGFEHNAVMRPLALHGIDPAVLHTPLWQPERMVQAEKSVMLQWYRMKKRHVTVEIKAVWSSTHLQQESSVWQEECWRHLRKTVL